MVVDPPILQNKKKLSTDFELLFEIAENAAKEYIFARVKKVEIKNLQITCEFVINEGIDLTIDVNFSLVKDSKIDERKLAKEAVNYALEKIDPAIGELLEKHRKNKSISR